MLRFIDGFDHLSSDDNILLKYDSIGSGGNYVNKAPGRRGGEAVDLYINSAGYLKKTLDDQSRWIVGFAFYMKNTLWSSSGAVLKFLDSAGGTQCSLYMNNNGTLSVRRGTNNELAVASQNLSASTWYYVEIDITISNSVGAAKVRVNEHEVLNVSGVDTQYSSSLNTARSLSIHGGASSTHALYDDYYICDGTGTTNNSFLGDVRVDTLLPAANGTYSEFTPLSGDNFSNVNEPDPDRDTTYNSSDVAGAKDTFDMSSLASLSGGIYGVQLNNIARKDDAGSKQLTGVAYGGSTSYTASTVSLSDSYMDCISVFEQNPSTLAAWSQEEVNAFEFGYKEGAA